MSISHPAAILRIAILVDRDNVSPGTLAYTLEAMAPFGRVVIRRGYGNHMTLANKWQRTLLRHAFAPCLQYHAGRPA